MTNLLVPRSDVGEFRRRYKWMALFAVLAMMALHVLWWATVPVLWLAFLVVVVLFATGTVGRSRPRQDR